MAQPNVSRKSAWTVGILAAVGLGGATVLSLGISVIFWGPAAVLLGIGMWMVYAGRRRRLMQEHRNADEMKDPRSTDRHWPSEGVIDDRLPSR
jgi:hypothetical protein